jgi:hypothetical protein
MMLLNDCAKIYASDEMAAVSITAKHDQPKMNAKNLL